MKHILLSVELSNFVGINFVISINNKRNEKSNSYNY